MALSDSPEPTHSLSMFWMLGDSQVREIARTRTLLSWQQTAAACQRGEIADDEVKLPGTGSAGIEERPGLAYEGIQLSVEEGPFASEVGLLNPERIPLACEQDSPLG